MTRDLLSMFDFSKKDIIEIIRLAKKIKKNKKKYEKALRRKTLLMIFAKPSLRTHLSFDIAMYQLGGHAIFYDLSHSTLGKKESIKDFSSVVSRYVDIVMARLFSHKDIVELAKHSNAPVVNGLTDWYHPCQILGDLLTIDEHLGSLKGKRICFIGDANNNVTHSLVVACSTLGIEMVVCAPNKKEFMPLKEAIGNSKYEFEEDPKKAVREADVIYSDSWMSYHIPKSQEKKRLKALEKYKVNSKLFSVNPKSKFMHCLPATRGIEVTDKVMDSTRSIVYDQAENRLHIEKAILIFLSKKYS